MAKTAASEVSSERAASLMVQLRIKRDNAIAERLELQNEIASGALAHRDLVSSCFGKLYSVWTGVIYATEYNASPTLLAVLGVTGSAAEAATRTLIGDCSYAACGEAKRDMELWMRKQKTTDGG